MRSILATSLALAATAGTIAVMPEAAGSKTPLTLTKLHASWIGSSHTIFVDTTWRPKRYGTRVTVKITVNGDPLRTLKVTNWVIGHKLFQLAIPTSVASSPTMASTAIRCARIFRSRAMSRSATTTNRSGLFMSR